eukprot:SAG22_NODE_4763_length_1171_cov_8.892724_1_plen_96_part_00
MNPENSYVSTPVFSDSPNMNGQTPLHTAADYGQVTVAELLLKNKASVDALAKDARTPLWWAAAKGKAAVAEVMLTAGADRTKKSESGKTPAYIAK